MDADKLNEAAKHFAAWETINSTDPNNNYYCKWGFIKGAKWLMSQSLADRLTEEEKERIMQVYRHASCPSNRVTFAGQTVLRLFPSIFGKELFNEK